MRKALAPILILAIIGTLGVFQREILLDIFARLMELPRIRLVPLACAAMAMLCARGFFLSACSPGVTLRQAIMADQAALAAGYGIVLGGGAVGTGMRIHMFTTWGIAHLTIASSIIATAVVPSFTTWGLPSLLLIGPVLGGTASSEQILAVAVGIPLIVVSFVFWWLALRSSTLFSIVGRFTGSVRSYLLRKIPLRFSTARAAVERTQPLAFSIEMRDDIVQLLRGRWVVIFTASVSTLIAGFTCLWTSSVVFDVEGLTFREALVVFSLVRVVIALSPIPGGTGLAEVGLIVLLERAGVSTIDATGMTLLYRFLTWFMPIVVGSATWWRYNHARSVRLIPLKIPTNGVQGITGAHD
ncbi:MAG: lysylphosphatidylglycerol synthase domain-containing protein [Actinobacteria bacterium]|nr:lysylphosphatidylglycerol synthase domain-containing protein [Actinomycetota bacterium]